MIVSGSFMDNLTKIINTTYVAPDTNTKTFMNYQTLDAAHLFTYASAMSEDVLNPQMSIHPASQLIFQTYSDNTIKAFLNDAELSLIGCQIGEACQASDFVAAIQKRLTTTDWESLCATLV